VVIHPSTIQVNAEHPRFLGDELDLSGDSHFLGSDPRDGSIPLIPELTEYVHCKSAASIGGGIPASSRKDADTIAALHLHGVMLPFARLDGKSLQAAGEPVQLKTGLIDRRLNGIGLF